MPPFFQIFQRLDNNLDHLFWENVFEPFSRHSCIPPNPEIFKVCFNGFFSNFDIG